MNTQLFDVEWVRAQFPALQRTYKGRSVAYLDGPGGSQVVQSAIDAIADYMKRGGANLHGVFPSSVETEEVLGKGRTYAAALLGASESEIAFGANMTTLNLAISRALAGTWSAGENIVVTELDHRANVDPWLRAAADRDVEARWLRVRPDVLKLDLDDATLASTITEGTRVVAVGLASNGVGTVTDVARVAKRAHEVGAIVVVDAVHAAPHMVINRDALGADVLLCSAYKFFGPHVGIACIREQLFEELGVYKLKPAPDYVPDKLETGTQNHEGIAGVAAAIEFIAEVGRRCGNVSGAAEADGSAEANGSLRQAIVAGLEAVEVYEDALAARLRRGLADCPRVRLYAAGDEVRKTPTVAFTVDGIHPREVCSKLLEEQGLFVADGDFYASTLAEKLGVQESGGWIRAGLAPYNTVEEVDALVAGVRSMVAG